MRLLKRDFLSNDRNTTQWTPESSSFVAFPCQGGQGVVEYQNTRNKPSLV